MLGNVRVEERYTTVCSELQSSSRLLGRCSLHVGSSVDVEGERLCTRWSGLGLSERLVYADEAQDEGYEG